MKQMDGKSALIFHAQHDSYVEKGEGFLNRTAGSKMAMIADERNMSREDCQPRRRRWRFNKRQSLSPWKRSTAPQCKSEGLDRHPIRPPGHRLRWRISRS